MGTVTGEKPDFAKYLIEKKILTPEQKVSAEIRYNRLHEQDPLTCVGLLGIYIKEFKIRPAKLIRAAERFEKAGHAYNGFADNVRELSKYQS